MLNVHPVGNAVTRGGARPLRRRLSCGLLAFSRGTLSSLIRAGCRVSSVPRDGTLLGSLFESLACLSVRTFAQASGGRTHHLREKDGRREVDFVVEQDAGIIAFEVKLSATVDDRDVRHLLWLRDEVGDDLRDLVVLTTGPEAYRRADGVAVVSLALLGA